MFSMAISKVPPGYIIDGSLRSLFKESNYSITVASFTCPIPMFLEKKLQTLFVEKN